MTKHSTFEFVRFPFAFKGTPVFWLPKNATEALNAVKASIVALQNGRYAAEMFDDDDANKDKTKRWIFILLFIDYLTSIYSFCFVFFFLFGARI